MGGGVVDLLPFLNFLCHLLTVPLRMLLSFKPQWVYFPSTGLQAETRQAWQLLLKCQPKLPCTPPGKQLLRGWISVTSLCFSCQPLSWLQWELSPYLSLPRAVVPCFKNWLFFFTCHKYKGIILPLLVRLYLGHTGLLIKIIL